MRGLFQAARLLARCEHHDANAFDRVTVCASCGAYREKASDRWTVPASVKRVVDEFTAPRAQACDDVCEEIFEVVWELVVEGSREDELRRVLGELQWMAAMKGNKAPQ